jgi:Guanine nucleotide exchange factor in Golgi transport N-terminal
VPSCACRAAEGPQLVAALEAMARLCGDSQLMVDFFVNYDCDLQARAWAHLSVCL